MFDIEENLKKLPTVPGVYLHKDKLGQVIYVGKAISLRNRVRQYFRAPANLPPKIRSMVPQIGEFEYITCGSEMEALILECNLIKKYAPKYNVLLRDDKTYPYIKISLDEEWPRLYKTRRIGRDGGKYFGPYSDTGAVNETVELLNRVYKLKTCSAAKFPAGHTPCLNYHIGLCRGVCIGKADRAAYRAAVVQAMDLLQGKDKSLLAALETEMKEAAEALDFERAAELRDRIAAIKTLGEKQRVTIVGAGDLDIVLTVRGTKEHHIAAFYVRDGKLSGRETFDLQAEESDRSAELAAAFIKQYYGGRLDIPREILVAEPLPEMELIADYLSQLRGSKVLLNVPQRGDKRALLALAQKDAAEMSRTIDDRARNRQERENAVAEALRELIGGSRERCRVEAYDISNTNGVDTVGAMVVFFGTEKIKKDYRRFQIRTVGNDDYAALQEVIFRRFRRAEAGDERFLTMPDVLLIDGGKGQVSAVEKVLSAMKLQIPVLGMAKDDKHRTRALVMSGKNEQWTEIPLRGQPLLYQYIGTVQEEVHRFAIDYHHGLRGKHMRGSVLDQIEGIGEKKRNALLTHFGSIDAVKAASVQELMKAPGIHMKNAEAICAFFASDGKDTPHISEADRIQTEQTGSCTVPNPPVGEAAGQSVPETKKTID